MLTIDSTLRDLLTHVPTYQPVSIEGFYKAGWWVAWPEQEQTRYIDDLGLGGVDLAEKSFMDVGCAEGYACFHAERQGARLVIGCDGHGWKYGSGAPYPWNAPNAQNMILVFEVLKLLQRSRVIRLVQDLESPDFVDSVERVAGGRLDVVLCAGVLYHAYNPVLALRHLRLVTAERAIVNIPDFRELQADGRGFTPYDNRPAANDFNYTSVLRYGSANNRLWNLSPDDWASMMEFVGFRNVSRSQRGIATVYECEV